MALFDNKKNNIPAYQKSIEEKSASIRRYYDEIGRLYYGQYRDLNVDNTKDINTRCEAVSKLATEIEDLNLMILFERGLKRCTSCGTENALAYDFCFKCGAKFDEESAKAPQRSTPIKPIEVTPEVTEAPAEEAPAEDASSDEA